MSTLGVLFWNTCQNALEERIERIVSSIGIDLLIFVEPGAVAEAIQSSLQNHGDFRRVSDPLSPLHIYSRVPGAVFITLLNDARWQILIVRLPSVQELLLTVAHLPSKLHADNYDQENAAIELSQDIRYHENQVGHSRTILVGDLNMNPFEPGVVMANGLNATSTRFVAERESRTVSKRGYPLFYNPMWSTFGDRSPGPPGSYYRSAGKAVNYYWNVYDQVLLRPALMSTLVELRLLDTDGRESLLTENGIPDKSATSDHLPLYFKLDLASLRS